MTEILKTAHKAVEALFKAGAHYAFSKSRRHPSSLPFLFGNRNRVDVFDLEKTEKALEEACLFIEKSAQEGKQVVFVATKPEAAKAVRAAAERVGAAFVTTRWVGGAITNYPQIVKRINELKKLTDEREKGLLTKYTKKERVLIDRDIARLTDSFGGLVGLTKSPDVLFVVDPRHEAVAVAEARSAGVPIVALAGSDCNLTTVTYPIPANDTIVSSITHIVEEIAKAFEKGRTLRAAAPSPTKATEDNSSDVRHGASEETPKKTDE